MEFIQNALPLVNSILQIIGGITLAATLIVRLTPSPDDDKFVSSMTAYWLKVIRWLPTIGLNPQTKKLEEALEEYEKIVELKP